MSKKIISVVLALLIITISAFGFSGCSQESEYPVTVGSATVGAEPNSIVVLSKNLADIISCIGYDIKMTGRSDAVTQKGFSVVPSVGDEATPDVQAIADTGADIVFAESNLDSDVKAQLEKTNNVEAAAKLGEVIAKKALDKGITDVVFDRGGFIYQGKVQALAEAAREAGLKF